MPELERDPYGAVDAHEAALNHYGIKNSGMPDIHAPPKDTSVLRKSVELTEGTGMPVPKRKAVPNAGSAPTRPPAPVTAPPSAQKPAPAPPARVGTSKFGEASMPTDPKPVRLANAVPGTQPPSIEERKIFRTDGKFDPATIKGNGYQNMPSRYTPIASPSRPPARPGTPPPSRPPRKRADSGFSSSSWSSRRDSISRLARRLSDAFEKGLDIVKMDKHDRRDYVRNKYDEEEKKRSRDSGSRSDSRAGSSIDPRDQYSEPNQNPPDEADFDGKPRPGNLSKGEKFAIGISQAIDPLKPRGRSGTNESDMSFGMTDLAPPGAMQECAECLKPTHEYLIKGLCKDCHDLEMRVLKKSQGK